MSNSTKRSRSSQGDTSSPVKIPKINHNEDLCTILMEMGKIEKNKGLIHKWKAYRTSCESLRGLDHRISSGKEASKLPGIGARIAQRIDEILSTGDLEQLKEYHDDPIVKALNIFSNISGVGPKGAAIFIEKGYRTLSDITAGNEKLTAHQHIGIQYYDDFLKKIPFDEVAEIASYTRTCAQEIDQKLEVTPCGSHRRLLKNSGDVDCLLTHPVSSSDSGDEYIYLRKLTEKLRSNNFITDVISLGSTKLMAVCKLPSSNTHRRIDVRWVPYDAYPTAILYFTGSNVFNTQMRFHANKLGYSLNEYSLHKIDPNTQAKLEKVPISTERDIFDILKYDYLEPEDRNM